MNLAESNEFVAFQEKKGKKKKMILFLIIFFIIACIILMVSIFALSKKRDNTEKLFLNGNKVNLSPSLFIVQKEKKYVSIKEMATVLGVNYVKGEYKSFTQDIDHCYIESEYEIVSFSKDSKYVKKYIQNKFDVSLQNNDNSNTTRNTQNTQNTQNTESSYVVKAANDTMELYELSSDVILVNNMLYVPMDDINKMFNINFSIKKKDYNIYTLDYLFKSYGVWAQKNGIEISNIYENVRALSDGYLIGRKNNKFGVVTGSNEERISYQYNQIIYSQNNEEFFVYTKDTVGLLDNKGETIIKPTKYDALSIFDEKNKLYLAEKDGKYGVLDINNDIIVPVSFSAVGKNALKSYEDFSDIFFTETPNLLEEKYIMVLDDEKLGLFDLEGNKILRTAYDSFGYLATSSDKKNQIQNTLIIPKDAGIYGIIVKQNNKYGIFEFKEKDLSKIPCSLTKIYSKVEGKKTGYYMELGEDEIIKIRDYIEENFGIIDEDDEEENDDEIEDEEELDENDEVEDDIEKEEEIPEEIIEEELIEENQEEEEIYEMEEDEVEEEE